MRTILAPTLVLAGSLLLGPVQVHGSESLKPSSDNAILFTCWAVYSTLGIIGREDGQDLVASMFKAQAHDIWRAGMKRDIHPLDPRYTEHRDILLKMYREGRVSYDQLMEMNMPCDMLL